MERVKHDIKPCYQSFLKWLNVRQQKYRIHRADGLGEQAVIIDSETVCDGGPLLDGSCAVRINIKL